MSWEGGRNVLAFVGRRAACWLRQNFTVMLPRGIRDCEAPHYHQPLACGSLAVPAMDQVPETTRPWLHKHWLPGLGLSPQVAIDYTPIPVSLEHFQPLNH